MASARHLMTVPPFDLSAHVALVTGANHGITDQPLEEQIAQWRTYLRGRKALHGPDVEELEGHLRDQLAALTEAGLAGDEAFLVAVKRMGSLDALSREFARAHSERLWKQLVVASDPDVSANTPRIELLVVLSLAVAAALAVKLPALFGLSLSPHEKCRGFTSGTRVFSSFHCSRSTPCGSMGGALQPAYGSRWLSRPPPYSPTSTPSALSVTRRG
jgi:hypothetical protein